MREALLGPVRNRLALPKPTGKRAQFRRFTTDCNASRKTVLKLRETPLNPWMLFLLLIVLPAGLVWGQSVTGPVGVTIVRDAATAAERPYAFVAAGDTHLWVHWWDGTGWQWADQGVGGSGIAGRIGVITVKDSPTAAERAYAFVRGSDNHLWVNWWNGTGWSWSDQGGVVADKVGVITVKDAPASAERLYAFVRGFDNHLWLNWWNGTAWNWSDQGGSITGGVGALTVKDAADAAERPYAFVQGTDNHLWVNWWDGMAWHWSDQGGLVLAGVGAVTVKDNPTATERPYAFVQGTDNHLWVNWWDGHAWHWSDQGGSLAGPVGVVKVKDSPTAGERAYVFVRGSDNHLLLNWWTGTGWRWSDQGAPFGRTVIEGVGVVAVKDSATSAERPYAFVRGSDNHLWMNWWDGRTWHWSDQGALSVTRGQRFSTGLR